MIRPSASLLFLKPPCKAITNQKPQSANRIPIVIYKGKCYNQ